MKLSTKIILPIILISALLILLNGCFGVPTDEEPGYTPGTITGIIAAPCCSTSAESVSEPCCVSPEYWCYYCQKTWSLQDGIEVVLTYGEDVVAATITSEDGEFTFTNVSPGKNYVVTAYCPDYDDNRPLVKDVALEIASTFDTKITDLVSTSLGLVVDFLVYYTEWGPEDISLDEVIADQPTYPNFPKFKALIYEVRRVVENCELNLLTDDDVQYATCRAAEEISGLDIGCGAGYTPPTPGDCDGNLSAIIDSVKIDGVLVDPYDTVNVILGESYDIEITAHDQDKKLGTLTHYATANGFESPATTSNQVTVTPILPGEFEVYVFVHDGCDETKWGPVTVDVDCCPLDPILDIDINIQVKRSSLPPLCLDDCAIINSVTVKYTGTDPLPNLVITDFFNDNSLDWTIPAGIIFTKTTNGGTICLDGGLDGTPGTYKIDVTYTDLCEKTASGSVEVTFEDCSIQYTLTVGVNPADSALDVVDIIPSRGDHPGYAPGSTETVSINTSTVPTGWQFVNWTDSVGGTQIGTDPTGVIVTMDADKTVIANFEKITYTLTLNVEPAGSGSTTGQGIYDVGTPVNISASANLGWKFQNWTVDDGSPSNVSGDLNTEPLTVTMNEDMTLTAHFMADIFEGGIVTIAFEDLEIPRSGSCDYDYNDWVVDLTINTLYDGITPNLTQVKFNVLPEARGAGYDHRFHILIKGDTFTQDGTYDLEVTGQIPISGALFDASADNDFIVIPDTRAALGSETHNHTNTKECEGPIAPTVTAVLTIDFSSPFYHDFSQYDPYSASSMHGEGLFFDPYLEIDTGTNNQFDPPADDEIHTADIRMLTVPDDWSWPEEGEAIWDVYTSVTGPPLSFSSDWWNSGNNCVYGDNYICGVGSCP